VKRRLFNLLAAASLALCLATAALWVHSSDRADCIGWALWGHDSARFENQKRWFAGIDAEAGRLVAGVIRETEGGPIGGTYVHHWQGFLWNHDRWPLGWFDNPVFPLISVGACWINDGPPPPGRLGHWGIVVRLPFWMLVLGLSFFPSVWLRTYVLHRRWLRERGRMRCRVCGYDLRATPDRCPECGTNNAGKAEMA